MRKNIIFSIVIATFQAVKSLRFAIESVIGQDFDPSEFELIVIDGLSDDGTVSLVQDYAHNVAYFVSETDNGIYDAWNKGIRFAQGQWILFIGSDDILSPDALSSFYSFILKNPKCEYVSAQVHLRSASGRIRLIGQPWEWNSFRRFMKTAHVASIHSNSLFKRYGSFSLKYSVCADYEYFLRIGPSLNAGYLPTVVATMAEGGVSQSSLRPLFQSRRIKLSTKSASLLEANLDFIWAFLNWSLRKMLSFFLIRLPI